MLDDLQTAIGELPGVEVATTRCDVDLANRRFDLVLTIAVKDQEIEVVVEAKASGYPRDVQTAASQLALLNDQHWPRPLIPLVAAPAISETSRSLLRGANIGYWDSGGSLYLPLPNALYWIDRPVPRVQARKRVDIFRGSATQVLHALLLQPDRSWHVQEIAALAEVSKSTAHQVLVALEEQLWVEKHGKGPQTVRRLVAPGDLLDAWADRHSLNLYQHVRLHRWARHPSDLMTAAASACDRLDIDCALTLASGAQLVAPYATDSGRLTILTPESFPIADFASAAELRPVDEGENVVLLRTKQATPLMFRQRVDEVWIASDIQLYLDLSAWPQRGKEQAQHLRQERIGF